MGAFGHLSEEMFDKVSVNKTDSFGDKDIYFSF